MRDPNVWLANDAARCVAEQCQHKGTCAGALAPIPGRYATIADFSRDVTAWRDCGEWLSAANARRPATGQAAPRVHPPLGGAA